MTINIEDIKEFELTDEDDAMYACSRDTLVTLVDHAAMIHGLKPITVVSDINAWIEFYDKEKCAEIFQKLVKQLDGTTFLTNYHVINYDGLGADEAHFICRDKRLYASVVMIYCTHVDGGWSIMVEVHTDKFVATHQNDLLKITTENKPFPL